MTEFKVTLTHKEKTTVQATTPQEALEKAKQKFEKVEFEPDTFSVKQA